MLIECRCDIDVGGAMCGTVISSQPGVGLGICLVYLMLHNTNFAKLRRHIRTVYPGACKFTSHHRPLSKCLLYVATNPARTNTGLSEQVAGQKLVATTSLAFA